MPKKNDEKIIMEMKVTFQRMDKQLNHIPFMVWQDKVLIIDCTGVWVNDRLHESAKAAHPHCDDYVCVKMYYVTSPESDSISNNGFCLVSSGCISAALEPLNDRHPKIKKYYEYIQKEFMERLNKLHDAIFNQHDLSVIETEDGKKYLLSVIIEKLYERNITVDWNETNKEMALEICKIIKEILYSE